jgi:hypothetical protein
VIKGLHIVVVKGEKSGSGMIVMQYLNYEEDIIKKARLKLVGWPPDVEFCKPGAIRSVTDLHQLWGAIECRELYFWPLTIEEKTALQLQVNQMELANQQSTSKRRW